MPELPEVHTTVIGLDKYITGLHISDVWTDYNSSDKRFAAQIKNPIYFRWFRKQVRGATVTKVHRRAKNILIELDTGFTILIHMKMTGHIMYGTYRKNSATLRSTYPIWAKETWIPNTEEKDPLWDPFNRFIHIAVSFANGKHIVLSDMRKFAKVALFETHTLHHSTDLKHIGPEPLSPAFTCDIFCAQILKRKNKPIKSALMDQELVAGIGNIYSDEILWRAGVHPLSPAGHIPQKKLRSIYDHIRPTLETGIKLRGDSTSDYRNIDGRPGEFNGTHEAYQRTGKKCGKRGCPGTIQRLIIGGRSAHFCPEHQILY